MEKTTAKVFVSGRRQAVRIPKKFRFNTNEVFRPLRLARLTAQIQ